MKNKNFYTASKINDNKFAENLFERISKIEGGVSKGLPKVQKFIRKKLEEKKL